MAADPESLARKIEELEERVASLEASTVTRAAFDDEILSLEKRLRELREFEEG